MTGQKAAHDSAGAPESPQAVDKHRPFAFDAGVDPIKYPDHFKPAWNSHVFYSATLNRDLTAFGGGNLH